MTPQELKAKIDIGCTWSTVDSYMRLLTNNAAQIFNKIFEAEFGLNIRDYYYRFSINERRCYYNKVEIFK